MDLNRHNYTFYLLSCNDKTNERFGNRVGQHERLKRRHRFLATWPKPGHFIWHQVTSGTITLTKAQLSILLERIEPPAGAHPATDAGRVIALE